MKLFNVLKALTASSIIVVAGFITQICFAETAVIVHPSNNDAITPADIERLYLGKIKKFPGGGEAIPIDQEQGVAVREAFNASVLSKSSQQVKAYWSRLVFTGKGTPPKEVGGDAAVIEVIARNPNTIGYIDASAVDGSIKVIHKF